MTEYSIKNKLNASLFARIGQMSEILFITKHRIDSHIVSSIVSVIGRSRKNRIQIHCTHSHGCQIIQFIFNASQTASVERPACYIAFFIFFIIGGFIPVFLDEFSLSLSSVSAVSCILTSISPVVIPGKPVREYLIYNSILVPGWYRSISVYSYLI